MLQPLFCALFSFKRNNLQNKARFCNVNIKTQHCFGIYTVIFTE